MTKVTKLFQVTTPLIKKINGFERVGELTIEGYGYFRDGQTDFDIDFVQYKHIDVLPLLETLFQNPIRYVPQISEPVKAHMDYLFGEELEAFKTLQQS